MTPPILTALYAGLCALFYVYQTFVVINHRRGKKIGLGDGGDKDVIKAIRVHANSAETMPMALILLGLSEMLGAPAIALHVLGLMLLVGRVVHGLHFTGVLSHHFRPLGMVLTTLVIMITAVGLIGHALTSMG